MILLNLDEKTQSRGSSAWSRPYANESEYHQWFIKNVHHFELPDRQIPILIIGHEISLFGGSLNGGSGSADLIAVDADGKVWLIEAKIASSAEFGTVWAQLLRYRNSLCAHNRWDVLERQMLKFLSGRETCQPVTDAFSGKDSLHAVFKEWLATIENEPERDIEAFTLAVTEQFREGSLSLAVLADVPPPPIARKAADQVVHGGPKVWFTARHHEGKACIRTDYYSAPGISDFQASDKAAFYSKDYPRCRVDNLVEYLDPPLIPLVEDILYPGLHRLGWDGRDACNNRNSITVALPFGDRRGKSCFLRLIDIGWPDADASRVASAQRLPGSYGLKVLFHPYDLKKGLGEEQARECLNAWAPLLYMCGWRARGVARDMHRSPLSREDFRKFAKEFQYEPSARVKDFTRGDEIERAALHRFLDLMANITSEITTLITSGQTWPSLK